MTINISKLGFTGSTRKYSTLSVNSNDQYKVASE